MKRRYSLQNAFLVFVLSLFLGGCVHEEDDDCIAGLTGDLTLVIRLQHENHTLVNLKNYRDTIYVKFNTNEFPGMDSLAYDAIYIGEYPGDSVVISNLDCGKYYLFATGLESIHQVRVYGGIPFETAQRSGVINLVIPVSE